VIAGPLLGGVIAAHLSWQWIFWLNVPIGAVVLPLALTVLEERHGPDSKLDTRGLVSATIAAFGLVWALVRGDESAWVSAEVIAAFALGAAAAVSFVAWERRASAPMLPMRFFGSRRFATGIGSSFLLMGSLYSCVFFAAQFFQITMDTDALGAGLRLIPWTATLLVVAPAAAADRIGERPVLITGLVLQTAGVVWLALVASPDVGYSVVVVPFVIAGIGCSMAIPVSQSAVVAAVQTDEVGKAAGANNMFQELGGAFGLAITVAVFAAAGTEMSASGFIDGFRPAIAVAAALAAGGAIAATMIPASKRAALSHA